MVFFEVNNRRQKMVKTARKPHGVAYNVYCGYLTGHHNMLCTRRIMCSPYIATQNATFSNPHQRTWSTLQRQSAAVQQEPVSHAIAGGLALVALFAALALI